MSIHDWKQYHKMWLQELKLLLDDQTGVLREEYSLYRRCPLCGSDNAKVLFLKMGFRFVQCDECRFVYVNPIVNDSAVQNVHSGAAYDYCYEKVEPRADEFKCAKTILRQINSYVKAGRLLDVGCGSGAFLKVAKTFGFETWGCELNKAGAEQAERISGAKVVQKKIEDTDFPSEYFDVITFFQVLEHLEDPLAMLKEASRILRRGGCSSLMCPISIAS